MDSVKDAVIYGAGGLGREIFALIKRDYSEQMRVIGFVDDAPGLPDEISETKLLSKSIFDVHGELAVIFGFADPKLKAKVHSELLPRHNLFFPNIIARTAIVNPDVRMGCGVVVTDFCSISTNVIISNAVFFNVGTIIGHDATIDDYCSFMPQCAISGYVTIGRETLVGAKSFVLQGRTVGRHASIVAGSIVCKDVGDDEVAFGNPARTVKGK